MVLKKRRWFQFKLRTLIFLMLVSGPAICWGPDLYPRIFPEEQTLPSPHYYDGIYVPRGKISTKSKQFRLLDEARALKAAHEEIAKKRKSNGQ